MKLKLKLTHALFAACAIGFAVGGVSAQENFPGSKPIRIVVPYPAGGSADAVARLFGSQLAQKLPGTVIIENKAGASGTIGAESAPSRWRTPIPMDTRCC